MSTSIIIGVICTPIALYGIYNALLTLTPELYKKVYLDADTGNKRALIKLGLSAVGWFLMIYGGLSLALQVLPESWIVEGVSIQIALSFTGAAYGTWFVMHQLYKNAFEQSTDEPNNALAKMDKRLTQNLREKGFEVDEQVTKNSDLQATFVSQREK